MSLGSVAIAVLVLILAGVLLFAPKDAVPGAGQFEIVGRMAPDFVLSGTQGRWRLYDHLGKPMVLAFWTTWCGACKKDLVVLQDFYELYGDEYAVVGICPEYWQKVPQILGEYRVTFPVLYDPNEGVTKRYELLDHLRYPFTVFVDETGRVRCVWAYMLRNLEHLLQLLSRCGLN